MSLIAALSNKLDDSFNEEVDSNQHMEHQKSYKTAVNNINEYGLREWC